MHENKINGKRYIGQTSKSPEKRWRDGKGYVGNDHFYRAIQKYGWENFEHTILKCDLSSAEADFWEKFYIAEYQTTDYEKGYNIEAGGVATKVIPGITRQKMSQNHADVHGENNPMYGKHHSPEALEKMRQAKQGKYIGEHNPNYGNHKLAGGNHPMAKPVLQYDIDGNLICRWDSVVEAAQATGANISVICECCKHRYGRKTAGGFVWEYA